jgi:hypothetical protein
MLLPAYFPTRQPTRRNWAHSPLPLRSGSACGNSLATQFSLQLKSASHPVRHLDLEFVYSRSIPLHLNIFPFGVGVDLSWLFHKSHG